MISPQSLNNAFPARNASLYFFSPPPPPFSTGHEFSRGIASPAEMMLDRQPPFPLFKKFSPIPLLQTSTFHDFVLPPSKTVLCFLGLWQNKISSLGIPFLDFYPPKDSLIALNSNPMILFLFNEMYSEPHPSATILGR